MFQNSPEVEQWALRFRYSIFDSPSLCSSSSLPATPPLLLLSLRFRSPVPKSVSVKPGSRPAQTAVPKLKKGFLLMRERQQEAQLVLQLWDMILHVSGLEAERTHRFQTLRTSSRVIIDSGR
jgi:hypothetical protein